MGATNGNGKKHVHKYERVTLGRNEYTVYKCALSGCPHYIQAELAVGRVSECWDCGVHVTISKDMVWNDIKHPRCEKCKQERIERREALAEIQ